MIVETHRNYRLGFAQCLTTEDRDQLIDHLQQPASVAANPLQGRAQVDFMTLPSWGAIVVKPYMRGGLMRHVSRRHHLRSNRSRGESEFRILQSLRQEGLPVPEPIGWAEHGQLWVKTWLFIAEIPRSQTLSAIARTDAEQAATHLASVRQWIDRLVDLKIHHVDLHPGNVLVDDQNKVFLIDFDKASPSSDSSQVLRDRHHRRWNRALAKHGLPACLTLSLLS
jgi:tRNA A-37 threonylcarbamoyl transferase component Bud32